jgi:hypothetical protein
VELFLALNPTRIDIASKEVRPDVGGRYFRFGMWLFFIVVVLLGITLCIDAIVVAVIIAVLVVRIIFVFARSSSSLPMRLATSSVSSATAACSVVSVCSNHACSPVTISRRMSAALSGHFFISLSSELRKESRLATENMIMRFMLST